MNQAAARVERALLLKAAEASIVIEGKCVYGVLKHGDTVVRERMGRHVLQMEEDKQADYFVPVLRELHRKLLKALRA